MKYKMPVVTDTECLPCSVNILLIPSGQKRYKPGEMWLFEKLKLV